ncbi:GGDEF domain-containing protein [Vibrio sp.]|nr:GGDEF domain-containing protein [Vibrio sp.]
MVTAETSSLREMIELEMLNAIVSNSPDAIYVATASGYIIAAFAGKERMFELDYDGMIGKHYSEAYSQRFSAIISDTIQRALETNSTQYLSYCLEPKEIYILAPTDLADGHYWFEGRITPYLIDTIEQPIIVWNARDITQRVKLENEIKLLVERDDLTGIYNRRRFLKYLSDMFCQFKRYKHDTSVIMLDIDDFKMFNDQYGHLVGDRVIQHVTAICSEELRECDIIGRIGGEEFAIILPHTGLEQASLIAERLRRTIYETQCDTGQDEHIGVTISLGISMFLTDDNGESSVLRRADNAMYASKRSGKNQLTVNVHP